MRQHDIDVLLISESHCSGTEASKLLSYDAYTAKNPSAGNAKGGAVILIRFSIFQLPITPIATDTDKVQLALAAIETALGPINFGAVYCPRDSYVLLTNSMSFWKFTVLNS